MRVRDCLVLPCQRIDSLYLEDYFSVLLLLDPTSSTSSGVMESPDLLLSYFIHYISIAQHHHTNNNHTLNLSFPQTSRLTCPMLKTSLVVSTPTLILSIIITINPCPCPHLHHRKPTSIREINTTRVDIVNTILLLQRTTLCVFFSKTPNVLLDVLTDVRTFSSHLTTIAT